MRSLSLVLDLYANTVVYKSQILYYQLFQFSQETLELTPVPTINRAGERLQRWSVSAP